MSLFLARALQRAVRRVEVGEALREKVRQVFSLDYRALALFRMALGATVCADVCLRLVDLNAFYSDAGWTGSAGIARLAHTQVSLHRANSSAVFQLALFLVQLLAAASLSVGFRTAWSAGVSFLLLTSLHTHVPLLLNGGDDTLRMFLLWACFLPLGRRWSLDAALRDVRDAELAAADPLYAQLLEKRRRRPWRPADDAVCSVASVAFKLNVVCLYVIAAAMKSGSDWSDGTAVHYALFLSAYITHAATYVRDITTLCRLLTHATMVLELYGPLLYVQPFHNATSSLIAVTFFVGLHASFLVFFRLGLFPLACICVHLALLPTEFFEWLETQTTTRQDRRVKVVYDPQSRHAAVTVRLLEQFCIPAGIEVWPAPSTRDAVAPQRLTSQHAFAHFPNFSERLLEALSAAELRRRNAPLAVLESTGQGVNYPGDANRWRIAGALLPLPRWLRRAVGAVWQWFFETVLWELVTTYLHSEAAALPPRTPQVPPSRRVRRRLVDCCVGVLMALSIYSNLESVHVVPASQRLLDAVEVLRVQQWWSMFAPAPMHSSANWLMIGELKDGSRVNFDNGGPAPTALAPFDLAYTPDVHYYASARWRRAIVTALQSSDLTTAYGVWLCNQWNAQHWSMPVTKVFFLMRDVPSPAPGFTYAATKAVKDSDKATVIDCVSGVSTTVDVKK